MRRIKYSFCIDENEQLVHIKSLSDTTRHDHKYYCLQCGRGMVPNLGTRKAWYFSHKVNTACDGESYLHKLAKRRIQEKFLLSDSFPITFTRDVPCSNHSSCFFYQQHYCKKSKSITLDLKNHDGNSIYDLCEEEILTGEFQPDLILKSTKKPERVPVFIEIFVTHKSEKKKLDSGNKIIETTKIVSESDIEDILTRGFVESSNCTTYNFSPIFQPEELNDIPIERFVLYKSGKVFVYNMLDCIVYCDKRNEKIKDDSVCELNLKDAENDMTGVYLSSYKKGLLYLHRKGYNIRNCIMCEFYRYNEWRLSEICIMYKKLGLQNPIPEYNMAKNCPCFRIASEINGYPNSKLEKEVELVP